MKELPDPLPLRCRPPKNKLGDVEVVDEQRLADPVDHHGNWGVGVGDLEDPLDVLPVGHHVHVCQAVYKVVGDAETGEAGVNIRRLAETWKILT